MTTAGSWSYGQLTLARREDALFALDYSLRFGLTGKPHKATDSGRMAESNSPIWNAAGSCSCASRSREMPAHTRVGRDAQPIAGQDPVRRSAIAAGELPRLAPRAGVPARHLSDWPLSPSEPPVAALSRLHGGAGHWAPEMRYLRAGPGGCGAGRG